MRVFLLFPLLFRGNRALTGLFFTGYPLGKTILLSHFEKDRGISHYILSGGKTTRIPADFPRQHVRTTAGR